MKRREFMVTSAAAVSVPGVLLSSNAVFSAEKSDREYIGIKTFWAKDEDAQKKIVDKLTSGWIPVMNELGFPHVGVLTVNRALHADDKNYDKKYDLAVWLVTSHSQFESFRDFASLLTGKLSPKYYLNSTTADALYKESTGEFYYAFPHCPKLNVPVLSPDRVVQFRRYNSPNMNRNAAKLRMFDVRGELDLFRKCGLNPVFFGETLFGLCMPNISYMVAFENDDARKKAWAAFIDSNEWKAMKSEEEFKDTATIIRNLFLKPAAGSQI